MNVETWLAAAVDDAERRGLGAMKPMLETLARSLAALRAADEAYRLREDRPGAAPEASGGAVPR